MSLNRPVDLRIVLVRTLYDRNVGSVSRAMSNMGFSHLILVDPKCELTYEAQQAAATGQSALAQHTKYRNWEEFYSTEPKGSIRLAFTARDGKGRLVRDIGEVFEFIKTQSPQFKHKSELPQVVHLIFGPEDCGLNAEDLEDTHFCASIPIYGENTSLNLAQAVLIAMYELRKYWGGKRTQFEGQKNRHLKENRTGVFPDKTLITWLENMGFDLSKRKMNVYKVLKRMLLQNTPTSKELIILETVLQQSIRKQQKTNEIKAESNCKSK